MAGDLIIDPTTTVTNSDNTYLQDATNFGSSTSLVIGKSAGTFAKRTIIKFNLAGSGVPDNATVLNAQMKLRYYGTSGTPWIDRWVQAHQLLRHWREGEADSLKQRNGCNWLTPCGKIGPGSDSTLVDANGQYESTVLFQTGEYPVWKNWDLTRLTQQWVNMPASNYGVILWATNEDTEGYTFRFHSSEATNSSDRPYLEVVYSTDAATKTVYFLKDHLGSIRATVLGSAGVPVIGYDDYDPWGYPLTLRTKPIPNAYLQGASKIKFTGNEWDDEFGVNWYHFDWGRPYMPDIARWATPDPVQQYSLSPYAYVANNPLRYVDPFGADSTEASKPRQAFLAPTPSPLVLVMRALLAGSSVAVGTGVAAALVAATPSEAGDKPIGNAGEDADQDGVDDSKDLVDNTEKADIVYRGGAFNPTNFTPRPGKDTAPGPKRGLSTFRTHEQATQGRGGTSQMLDLNVLRQEGFVITETPDGHVSIRPASQAELQAWAATREAVKARTAPPHVLTVKAMSAWKAQMETPRTKR